MKIVKKETKKSELEAPGLVNRNFVVDTDKIKNLSDVKAILKALNFRVTWYQDNCPAQFEEIYNKKLLKELPKE